METSAARITARLLQDGWTLARHGANHDIYRHVAKGVVVVPRHRVLSVGVARAIHRTAGWL